MKRLGSLLLLLLLVTVITSISASEDMCKGSDLVQLARQAVQKYPESYIEASFEFLSVAFPAFCSSSNDRLVKVGRYMKSLVEQEPTVQQQAGLENLLQECQLLHEQAIRVPTRPFGRTGLQMPIVTLGCMRFQQEWGPRIQHMNQVGSDCQDNLVEILKQAHAYGITHIETARGYGSSELQLGVALKQLFRTTHIRREDFIIQTKVNPSKDPQVFRDNLEKSFANLQVDYVDLFSVHGFNLPEMIDWVFAGEDNCWKVVQEYVDAGKIRHVGFSTHGATDLIVQLIETGKFEYVNLHYHYFGSYTDSGLEDPDSGEGNLRAVKLLHEKNMGIFIISPFDKGGRLYAPSRKLRSLTLPDMEPLQFGSQWLWNHHLLNDSGAMIHTFTVGAARPSDLDQPAVAAHLLGTEPEESLGKTKRITERLDEAKADTLGGDWLASWFKGLPKANDNKHAVEHNQIVWLYNSLLAFGMYGFAKNRYVSFEGNYKKWDESKSFEENVEACGKIGWGYVPGIPLKPNTDYSEDLVNVPEGTKARVKEAQDFVMKWLASKPAPAEGEEPAAEEPIPDDWQDAYDLRPWPDYPDQPSRK